MSYSEESLRTLKIKILGLLTSINKVFTKADEYAGEGIVKANIKEIEELIVGLNRDKNSGSKGVEEYIQKVCASVESFRTKMESIFAKNNENKREYEWKLEELKEIIEEKIVSFI